MKTIDVRQLATVTGGLGFGYYAIPAAQRKAQDEAAREQRERDKTPPR